jgi:hypothetical protein
MERHFQSVARADFTQMRLQPRLHLGKYVTGWQCSACDRHFDVNQRERQSLELYGDEVPGRIRHEFEIHRCSK